MSETPSIETPKTVPCPCCKAASPWSAENPYRPFCSEQCKNRDFIDWANEDQRIPGSPQYDELFSGDLGEV